MGRPKGIKNKNKKSVVEVKSKVKRKVGRPKKIKVEEKVGLKYTPSKYDNLPDDYVQPKTYKASGYCPRCDLCIMSQDFISKMIFECPRCKTHKHKKYLKDQSVRKAKEDEKVSKNEYLKEAASKNKDLERHHGVISHANDIPDIALMSEVKDD